ncbi:MAG: HAMP domain-containing histidine kinase [Oscillatoriales cyanobacterium SM2_2_1]|nr:HAMP domain-containing histidine kinase [Oscillatoriales cyanobacterium SM2_2_1]
MQPWTKTHGLLVGIFATVMVLEYGTPPPFVFGYLYIGAVLLASLQLGRRVTLGVTAMAAGLTILNLWIPGVEPVSVVTVANRSITVLALVITAWLGDRLRHYEALMTQQTMQLTTQTQLTKVREDFVSTITHDLKTPLLGAIETLSALEGGQFGSISAAQKRAIAIMMRSHSMSLQLLDTLLDVYRNDMDGLHLQRHWVNLTRIAEESMMHLTSFAMARQISLCLRQGNSDFRQDYWLHGDALQLQRVLSNLMLNAINHSPRGCKVEVAITLKNHYCHVQVLDEGTGLAERELPYLFERFYQGNGDRQAKGTGLGLYLSRQIVEAHGGKIWAEGRSPQGAIFTFCLPINP